MEKYLFNKAALKNNSCSLCVTFCRFVCKLWVKMCCTLEIYSKLLGTELPPHLWEIFLSTLPRYQHQNIYHLRPNDDKQYVKLK